MNSSTQASFSAQDEGPKLIAVSAFFVIITTIVISLRFYARYLARIAFWWDDWILLVAYIIITMSNCTRWWFVEYGLGKHVEAVDPSDIVRLLQVLWADMFLYGFGITFVKLGVIAFYFRIFAGRILRILLWVSTGIVVTVCVGSSFLVLLQCNPIHKFWDLTTPGTCIGFTDYIVAQAVPNIVTDFIVLTLPLPSLYRLGVSPSKKAALLGIFVVGYFVTGVSIARAVIIRSINPVQHKDLTWNFREPNLWSVVEQNVALICACFPPLAVVLRKALGKMKRDSTHNNEPCKSTTSSGEFSSAFEIHLEKVFSDIDRQRLDTVDTKRTSQSDWKDDASIHEEKLPPHAV